VNAPFTIGKRIELAGKEAWYVVETHSRAERVAQSHLERQGFPSFCPQFRKTRRHARRVDEIVAPVFPGYVFAAFDRDRDNWTAINGTRGVRRLVGPCANRPQPMPTVAMEALLARCDGDRMARLCPSLEQGRKVRVLTGPFADLLAEVHALDGRGRVQILLDILGGKASVAISVAQLAPA
jgi:transcription elongation factor/antiterminator RfaH